MNFFSKIPTFNPACRLWGITWLCLFLVFRTSIQDMLTIWFTVEEYSHGLFIPLIAIYLIWLRRTELVLTRSLAESWLGLIIITLGLAGFILGGLAALGGLEEYSFLVALVGLFAATWGIEGLRKAWAPLLFLIFMIPLPPFIISNLSSKLQLMSSWLGVELIRSCGILVFLEGNVIDLGIYKLQVVEACSGLRYLFPLSSLAYLCAFLFRGAFWQKALIFLSSIPLTIFMNSFRIAVIGVLVDNWGTKMAEGFLHDFEGWVVFVLCMGLLFVEMWLFSQLSGQKRSFRELVQIPEEWGAARVAPSSASAINPAGYLIMLLLLAGALVSVHYQYRNDVVPPRQTFQNFPVELPDWVGSKTYLAQNYLNELKLTDYTVIDYQQRDSLRRVNFYSAYYQSQRKGAGVHSPRSCIPGAGWQITLFEQKEFPELQMDGHALQIDRAIIEKSGSKQLVYFWFQQRGRIITNEYMLKWYIFYDAITQNRTDGALVRLVTDIENAEPIEMADQRLQDFLQELLPKLPAYIPGRD